MSDPVLLAAAACFGIDPGTLKPLAGGHFTRVLGFARGGRDYVLRITPPNDEITPGSIRAVLAWMRYLAARGVPVPEPAPSTAGELVEIIEQDGQVSLATVLTRADGSLAEERPVEQWPPELVEAVGWTVGRMHALARTYEPASSDLRRPGWEQVGSYFNPVNIHAADDWLVEKWGEVLCEMITLPKDPDGYGLIHGDLHFGNFFFDFEQRRVTIFDFDDCCYGWFCMDIAMVLLDATVLYRGPERDAFAKRFLDHFWRGYLAENPLPQVWRGRLPLFLRWLETGLYIRLVKEWDPAEADGWVGWFMQGRRERIEAGAPFVTLE